MINNKITRLIFTGAIACGVAATTYAVHTPLAEARAVNRGTPVCSVWPQSQTGTDRPKPVFNNFSDCDAAYAVAAHLNRQSDTVQYFVRFRWPRG